MEIVSNAVSSVRDSLIHLGNASLLTLGLVIAGIALVGYLLLRR